MPLVVERYLTLVLECKTVTEVEACNERHLLDSRLSCYVACYTVELTFQATIGECYDVAPSEDVRSVSRVAVATAEHHLLLVEVSLLDSHVRCTVVGSALVDKTL